MIDHISVSFESLPRMLCNLLATGGWRKFITPYENRLVEYNEDDFAKFLRADAPDGLGTTIDRLKRIWIATDSEDGRKALVILEKLDSSARVRRRDSSEH